MTQVFYSPANTNKKQSINNFSYTGSRKYYLMLKNKKVAMFSMTKSGMAVNVLEIYNNDLMPVGTRGFTQPRLNQRFLTWKQGRCIPKTRHEYSKIEERTGLNPAFIETVNMGVSITDCYWFCPVDENYSWENVNYHDNEFSEDISNIIINDAHLDVIDIKTPDITTNGILPKSWVRINGKLYLVKVGTSEKNQEVCNEVFASIIAEKLGIPVVPYYISKLKDGRCCSICESFIDDCNTEYVSMQQVSTENATIGRAGVVAFMNSNKMADFRNKMIVLDYLISNQDRHYGNFGYLRDAETLQIKGPAPLFDFDKCMNIGFWDLNVENDIAKPFAYTHSEQIQLTSNLDWVKLDDVKSSFKEVIDTVYSAGGFSKEEIKQMQDFFEKRVKQLEVFIGKKKEQQKQERVDKVKDRLKNAFANIPQPPKQKLIEEDLPPKKYTTSSSQDFQEITKRPNEKTVEEVLQEEMATIDTFDTVDWDG